MKSPALNLLFFLLALTAALFGVFQPQFLAAAQGAPVTPTWDPLVEPPLPPNPTELELGRNLYWHWCMTCHGDRGQGLTDEFREIWEEDHQNCWARGCHAGRPGDTGFPIPTYVPGIVVQNRLAQFASLQIFTNYLKATHPPQSPGVLKDEEYRAIALFVFTMNGRTIDEAVSPPPKPASTPFFFPLTLTASRTPPAESVYLPRFAPAGAAVLIVAALLAGLAFFFKRSGDGGNL